jgi:hypothetical protein
MQQRLPLHEYEGWHVVCTSRICAGRTVLGRVKTRGPDSQYWSVVFNGTAHSEGPWYDGLVAINGIPRPEQGIIYRLNRPRRPKRPGERDASRGGEIRVLSYNGPTLEGPEDPRPSRSTSIPAAHKVRCFSCNRVLNLWTLTRDDLRLTPP